MNCDHSHPFGWLIRLACGAAAALVGLAAPPSAGAAPLKVVATTSIVADLVREVAGPRAQVTGLMGPGVDPHLYKATASDITALRRAEVIFYNGLLLEGKMQDLFTRMARVNRHVYAVTESIPEESLLEPAEMAGHHDPHVWFDVALWTRCVDVVVKGLSEADPAGAKEYADRGEATRAKMAALDKWAREHLAEIPEKRRVLVTSHDAFNYFGRAHGFRVVALQGISTVSEAGLADMAKLVDFIKANEVRAIFVESSVPHAAIERISQDSGVRVGGELYSDALGTPGKLPSGIDPGTYDGMIRQNIETIAAALK